MKYIVVLNWNGHLDTIECLESLLHLDTTDFRIVVCDNQSSDGSVEKILDWIRIRSASPDHVLTMGTTDVMSSSRLAAKVYERAMAESGGEMNDDPLITIIRTGGNLGFAGGNNVGLRYCLMQDDAEYFWLLNNDTIADGNALNHLVDRARLDVDIGIVGSTLVLYGDRSKIQAYGGCSFSPLLSRGWPIGEGKKLEVPISIDPSIVESKLDYVIGASMLVTRSFLENVGLMQEDYFLYFEELDWAVRAKRHGNRYKLGYAPGSIVYHKVGASAGTARRSAFSLRLLYGNQLRFIRRFYPWLVPLSRIAIAWEGIKAMRRRRYIEARLFFSVMWASSKHPVRR